MIVKQNINLHNRFDIEVRDAKTGELKQQAYAENIILDALWTELITSASAFFSAIHIGTGSGTLSAARTSLFTFLFGKAAGTATYQEDYDNGWQSARRSIQISETEYVGSTFTEIGIAKSTTSTHLMTHAVLKDMNGNPVSILKTDTDIITFYATVYLRFTAAGWDSGKIKHTSRDNALLGTAQTMAVGASFYEGIDTLHLYANAYAATATRTNDVANKKVTSYFRIPAASGNYNSGINKAVSGSLEMWFAGMSNLTGNAIVGEQIGTGDGSTKDFQTAFPMVKSGAVIKVDGVTQSSGVTVDTGKPKQNITPFLRRVSGDAYILYTGNAVSIAANSHEIFENPYYQTIGLYSGTSNYVNLYCSDDMETWTQVTISAIQEAYRYKRYWKVVATTTSNNMYLRDILSSDCLTNVHFDAAPSTGAVITIDYDSDVITKDANHVFDLTIVRQFGEYTP